MTRPVLLVGFVLFVAMLGSNFPAPLYEIYRVRFATTTFAMTGVFAAYPLALIVTLIGFSRLPDRIGRRPSLALGTLAAALGSIVFATAHSVAALVVARLLAAVAIGAIGAAGPPMLVELDPRHDRRRAALVATFALSLACGVAPFLSGVLAVTTSAPLVAPFVLHVVLSALALAGLAFVPETRPSPSAAASDAPRLDPLARRAFAGAALTSGISWWLASLFVSIVPAFVATLLGARSPVLQGAFALLVFAVSPIAQTLARDVPDRIAARAGLISIVVALIALLGAVPANSLALFALGSIVAGIAHGLGFLGAQSTVNGIAPPAARARLSAAFYAVTYTCVGVPILVVGALSSYAGLYAAVVMVSGVAAVAALVLAAWLPATQRPRAGQYNVR
ncbi:MAG TPA: MFS transporter [Candidatus Elarobacter sp.]|nr:MFS transporter [Candidatus Elarobacter sp.]